VEQVIKAIRRATRKQYSAEEKIRIVLEGLRGEESIAALCRLEGIAESLHYNWSKEFLEAGKKRLAGDTARADTCHEVKVLRKEARDPKEVVAEQGRAVVTMTQFCPKIGPVPARTSRFSLRSCSQLICCAISTGS
jgi:transposase